MKIDLNATKRDFNSDIVCSEYFKLSKKMVLFDGEEFLINKYFDKNSSILDIGCGAGRLCFALKNLGYKRITGIDFSSKMIKYAKKLNREKKGNIKFKLKNIVNFKTKIKYDNAFFSYNGLMTIPKIDNRINALKNIYNILNNNGLLIFSTHIKELMNIDNFWEKESKNWEINKQNPELNELGDIKYPDKFSLFLHIPSEEEIKYMINQTNFKLVASYEKNALTSINNKNEKTSNCKYYVLQRI